LAAADDLEWITSELFRSGVRLIAGSDGGSEASGISQAEDLLLELEHLANIGIPAPEVLRAATVNAANCLGLSGHGLVESSAAANLLLLRANPLDRVENLRQIDAVVLAGRYINLVD
jgi:imidazolonepropionase-like amidohydrolase